MSRVKLAVLASCLLGPLLAACSQAEPVPKDFVLIDQRPGAAEESGNKLVKAERFCTLEAEKKSIGSVVAIFSHLRKGSADEDYVACMKARGYEVKP